MFWKLIKQLILNLSFAAVACGGIYGITVILIRTEKGNESLFQQKIIEADIAAAVNQYEDGTTVQKRFTLEFISLAAMRKLVTDFFSEYYPTERMFRRSYLVNNALNWKLGGGMWYLMSEGLLARYNRALRENSTVTTLIRICLPFTLTVVFAVAFAAMAQLVFNFFCVIVNPFMRFGIIRATKSYQKKLFARDMMATIMSTCYALGSAVVVAYCMKRRMGLNMKQTLFSIVFRLNGMYHPQHANDEFEMTLVYTLFLFSISSHLIVAKILIFHGISRTYRTWAQMDKTMMMKQERMEKILAGSKQEPKNSLVFHTKSE